MKKRNIVPGAVLFCGIALAGLAACQKTDTGVTADLSENTLKAASQTYTSEVFDEVMEIGDETLILYEKLIHGKDNLRPDGTVFGMGKGHGHQGQFGKHDMEVLDSQFRNEMHSKLGKCTSITREWAGDMLVTTINFGTDICVCFDGKVRSGKIIMSSIGDYWKGDAEVTFTTEDYFVDGNEVTGTSKVNSTINADGNRESTIVEEGSVILGDGSGTITWSSEKTRVVKKGSDTLDRKDDTVEVTGTASGTLLSGNTFTSLTETPLVRNHQKDCRGIFVSGITNITISDGTVIVVDYGDGTCDNLATVTTNGVSETITLESILPAKGHGHGRRH